MPEKRKRSTPRSRAFMNLTEVAKTLGEPTEVVRDWIQNGQLVGLKVGEDWRVARDEVARFEKERPGRGRDT